MNKLILAVTAFFLFSSFKPDGGYKVGDVATDFKLKNVTGSMIELGDNKVAQGFIVIFTCNHCPFSVKYEDRINELNKKYAQKGYPVVAINSNDAAQYEEDNFEGMVKRAKEKDFSFPYLHDETQAIARSYGATRTPHVYIVQKEKDNLIVKYIGAIDDNADDASAVKEKYVENAVDALLASKPVNPDFTKAIGCTIKWKK
ncbi:MAG: thioredoxin family protein [Bacteroidia bacterium]